MIRFPGSEVQIFKYSHGCQATTVDGYFAKIATVMHDEGWGSGEPILNDY